jgi:O-antigen ligase
MNKINNNLENILFNLIIFFPLIMFLRSFTINLVVFIIGFIFLFLSIQRKYNFIEFKFNQLLLIFYLYFFISQFFLYNNLISLFKTFMLLKFFLFFNSILYFYSLTSIEKLKKKLPYLLTGVLLFLADLLLQYFSGKNILGFLPGMCDLDGTLCQRWAGIFDQELIAGGYISTILISVFLLTNILFNIRIIFFIPILLLFFVFITGERSALILTLIFNIIYYIKTFQFTKKNIGMILIIFFSIFLLFKYSVKDLTKNRYTSQIVNHMKSNNLGFIDRLKTTPWGLHYNASLIMVSEKPILGHGYKSFRRKCMNYEYINIRIDAVHHVCSTHPHNFHLEILTDTGLLGYIILILSFYSMYKLYFNYKNLEKDNNSILLLLFFITFIFFPRPTGSILSTFFGVSFWYVLGSLIGYKILLKKLI